MPESSAGGTGDSAVAMGVLPGGGWLSLDKSRIVTEQQGLSAIYSGVTVEDGKSTDAHQPTFVAEHLLRVGGVEFQCGVFLEESGDQLWVMKRPELVRRYVELCASLEPKQIVELGIHMGGSTALLSELARPDKLLAIEIDPDPPAALTHYVEERGLAQVVRPYYGVDQADRTRVLEIVAEEIGDAEIDLVIDDASHRLEETRASFETLFPRLRPGGLFVIEDWRGDQMLADKITATLSDPTAPRHEEAKERLREAMSAGRQPEPPLTHLAVELLLARAADAGCIDEVAVSEFWLTIRRGPCEIDPETFRLTDLFTDHFGYLVKAPSP